MTSPPERERRPGKGGAESRGGRNRGNRTTRYTPGPPDPEYDEKVTEAAGYESDPLTADHWAATCMAVERGEIDLEDVDFPPDEAPLAAISSSRGGWKVF